MPCRNDVRRAGTSPGAWSRVAWLAAAVLLLSTVAGCGPRTLTDAERTALQAETEEEMRDKTDDPNMSPRQKQEIETRMKRNSQRLLGTPSEHGASGDSAPAQ